LSTRQTQRAKKPRGDNPVQSGLPGAPPSALPAEEGVFPLDMSKVQRSTQQRRIEQGHTVSVEDMPPYPLEAVRAIEQAVDAIPTDRVFLTYKEIWRYFGISRATIVRRMRDGFCPGIRIVNGRVLDEGRIRRFDRRQVCWLLLAVRFGKRTSAQ
jgi:hypothetical protein